MTNSIRIKISLLIAVATLSIFNGCKKPDEPIWVLKLKSRSYTTPIIHRGKFFVFSQAGEAICGDLHQGTIIWKQILSGPILADPALSDDGTLFVVTQNGFFYALDSQTGTSRWHTEISDTFIAPVTLTGSMLLLPSERGTLYARARVDGSAVWKFSGAVKFNAAATAVDQYILIGGWSRDFYCLKRDGTLSWKFITSYPVTNPAAVEGNSVLVAAYDGFIYSFDLPSGRMLWRISAKLPSNLVLMNGAVYFASEKELVGIAVPSGKLLHRRSFGALIDRLYIDQPNILALSSYVYSVDADLTHANVLVKGFRPIFKLSSAEGMLLACDDLYSIYGYGKSVP